MNHKDNDILLGEFEREIRKQLGSHLKELILFGSRARGDQQPDSDYDILAIVDQVTPRIKDAIDTIAGELLFRHNVIFSVFPTSEQHYSQRQFSPVFKNIRREGISL